MLISSGGGRDVTFIDSVTLTFNLLTSNKRVDRELSCTLHLPSLVMISPVVFLLSADIIHTHTHVQSR